MRRSIPALFLVILYFGVQVGLAEEPRVLTQIRVEAGKEVPVAAANGEARLVGWRILLPEDQPVPEGLAEQVLGCAESVCGVLRSKSGRLEVPGRFGAMRKIPTKGVQGADSKESGVTLASLGSLTFRNNSSFDYNVEILAVE